MQKLLSGMQSHLNSPVPKLRRLGMITAEALAKTLDAEGPQLKFEYEADDGMVDSMDTGWKCGPW